MSLLNLAGQADALVTELVKIRRHLETQTSIHQLHSGRPLTDAQLAELGIRLGLMSDIPWIRSNAPVTTGEIIVFERKGPTIEINNWGTTDFRVRLFGPLLPAPGQRIDSVPLAPEKLLRAGDGWYLTGKWCAGMLCVTANTAIEVVVD